jgi:hypothetical protein
MFLLKKDKILPIITPPVSFVNATYLCYLNQMIYLCSINIVRVLFNSDPSVTFSRKVNLGIDVRHVYKRV